MPKSRRNRLVSLTATKKKNFSDSKGRLVNELRDNVDQYERIFVFRIDHMRNAKLKQLRDEMKDSRFFFGKNKILCIGLGRTKADEYKKNLHKLSTLVSGQCGLLFTNSTQGEIFQFFDTYRHHDYARTGDVATKTVNLYEGPLKQFSHNLEPYLRQLGMPTTLNKGVVTLLKDFEVCKKGQPLTSEQARILKLLGDQMAEFRVKVEGMWSKDGKFEIFNKKMSTKSKSKSKDSHNANEDEEEEEEEEEEGGDIDDDNPDTDEDDYDD